MNGIDISAYQGEVQFHTLKAGSNVEFVYAKATEGVTYTDMFYARNKQVCGDLGIPFGAYHFFNFGVDPLVQANHFINTADFDSGDLVPMVDVEAGVFDAEALSDFVVAVEQRINQKMLVYTYYSYWQNDAKGYDGFSGHPLWIAEYNNDVNPALPQGWSDWRMWQYSSTGTIPGITGSVDLDRSNGDLLLI